MAEYAQSLDIVKFSNISKQDDWLAGRFGHSRSRDYWCTVDSEKGLIVDQNGLFARFSDGV